VNCSTMLISFYADLIYVYKILFGLVGVSCADIIIIIINKVLIKVTLNRVIAGALYIVICG